MINGWLLTIHYYLNTNFTKNGNKVGFSQRLWFKSSFWLQYKLWSKTIKRQKWHFNFEKCESGILKKILTPGLMLIVCVLSWMHTEMMILKQTRIPLLLVSVNHPKNKFKGTRDVISCDFVQSPNRPKLTGVFNTYFVCLRTL